MRFLTVLSVALLAAPFLPLVAAENEEGRSQFTLNILGKDRLMPNPTGGPGGHKIFVPLTGTCRIDLNEQDDFAVNDADCTDAGNRAAFGLPDPDPEDDGVASYRIYVKVLGKPGGNGTFTSCVEDANGNWCSTENVYLVRAAGFSPSQDVSRTMLTVCNDRDEDGVYEREQIFDDENADYYWKLDNNGLRHVQLKFLANTPTDISGPCPAV